MTSLTFYGGVNEIGGNKSPDTVLSIPVWASKSKTGESCGSTGRTLAHQLHDVVIAICTKVSIKD